MDARLNRISATYWLQSFSAGSRHVCILRHFADKVRPLAEAKNFLLSGDALNSFKFLKSELANVALHSIDELAPFIVECDASDVAVSATLNQRGRPVAFMSRTLQGSDIHYSAYEKKATAIIEAIRK